MGVWVYECVWVFLNNDAVFDPSPRPKCVSTCVFLFKKSCPHHLHFMRPILYTLLAYKTIRNDQNRNRIKHVNKP